MSIVPTLPREAAADALRSAGLRVTAPRVAVLECLVERPHCSADALRQPVNDQLGAVSTQAIYDVLNALTEAGLTRRIEPAGHPALFETRTGDNHHHLVCRRCGRTIEVDSPTVESWAEEVAKRHGFHDINHTLEIYGNCPDCAQ